MNDRNNNLIQAQKNEITEFFIYSYLAKKAKDPHNQKLLEHIAEDEKKHYYLLKKKTHQEIRPSRLRIFIYSLLAAIFGLSFTLRYMERGEKVSQKKYGVFGKKEFSVLLHDEEDHEQKLIGLLKDPRVEYASSIVLGLNDALVELTGALAGLTFALRDSRIIVLSASVTGFAAALSMAASAYLSAQEDVHLGKKPLRGAIYTGITYLATVIILVLPFLILKNIYLSLGITLTTGVLLIALYTFYITTAKNLKFWARFLKMVFISLGVAIISFGFGLLLRKYLGVG